MVQELLDCPLHALNSLFDAIDPIGTGKYLREREAKFGYLSLFPVQGA